MDIISYGIASQAAKEEKKVREEILAIGVEGTFPHVKARIDALDESLDNVVAYTNKLALNNAVNITKANAKLNIIAQTAKYNMHNMIFDDFLDLTGIDTANSSGYIFDALSGVIESINNECIVETMTEITDSIPKKIIFSPEIIESDEEIDLIPKYFVTRDEGETWEPIEPDTLFYFDDNISPLDNKLRIKAELPQGTKLLNYGLTWV